MKPMIRILHHMARSGGTVICRCLGCMKDAIVLSEIHPLGSQWFNPIRQAHKWFNLLTPGDIRWFRTKGSIVFADVIAVIQERCLEQNKTLILRDWSHLDFTAVPFLEKPSYRLLTAEALSDKFTINNTATVRHPIDQWLSLRNLELLHAKIKLEEFLRGYHRFADYCKEIGFIRYEDFSKSPQREIEQLCHRLSVRYDSTFIQNWCEYDRITGDTSSQRGYEKEIKPVPRRNMEDGLLDQFEKNPDYIQSIKILGYGHPM